MTYSEVRRGGKTGYHGENFGLHFICEGKPLGVLNRSGEET